MAQPRHIPLTMRIAIDLQACQQADSPLTRDSLALARHIAGHPGEHTLWITLNSQFSQSIEGLRAAFSSLLPAERILVYDLPASDGTQGVQHMIELIKDNFYASRGIELVFTPGDDGAGKPPSAHFLKAYGVAAQAELSPSTGGDDLVVEIGPDPAHVAQQALLAFELALRRRPPRALPTARRTLAWVAVRLPERTHPHARLIAALAHTYEIELVLPGPQAADESPPWKTRSVEWFEDNTVAFERIVYSVGNSLQHRFIFALLARHPGAVFLQDFSLGAVTGGDAGHTYRKALFESHAFTGLADELAIGRAATASKYPLNKTVLDLATGIMVESAALVTQAQSWYGPDAAEHWRCVPMPQEAQAACAPAWVDAIEAFAQRSPAAHYRALVQALRTLVNPRDARHPALLAAAWSIGANQPAPASRQLLVDVSAMVQLDAKTGISRVVRSILLALIAAPPHGYRVEAVYGDGGNRRYRYARKFTLALIGAGDVELEDAPIEQRPGDIFVGVDVAASITTQNAERLAEMRNRGIGVFFVVHDILPLLLPNMFAYGTDQYFRKYLATITRHADGLLCTTRAGADVLGQWVEAHPSPRVGPLYIGHFHLGADLGASAPSMGLSADAPQLFAAAAQRTTLLMVGTLEPRKGQAQALAAVELLWSEKVDINLVIVGKPGWMVEPLIRKLKSHPRLGTQLFWLTEASDEMLARLYGSCSALLAPSLGEGFGLPLIEAAQHGLPLIARALPVFKEICGDHAYYFNGETPHELADALWAWLALFHAGQAPSSTELPWISWSESTRRLLDCVIGQQWDQSLPGTPGNRP